VVLEQAIVRTDAGTEVRFTVSVGVATFTTGVPLAQAMETADQALYRAKQSGRNRVEVAPLLEARTDAAA
jgi:diguanylate cyclase (GGDEF)-like protein